MMEDCLRVSRSDLEVRKMLTYQYRSMRICLVTWSKFLKISKVASRIVSASTWIGPCWHDRRDENDLTKDCPFFLLAYPKGIPVEEAPLPGGLLCRENHREHVESKYIEFVCWKFPLEVSLAPASQTWKSCLTVDSLGFRECSEFIGDSYLLLAFVPTKYLHFLVELQIHCPRTLSQIPPFLCILGVSRSLNFPTYPTTYPYCITTSSRCDVMWCGCDMILS